MDPNKVLSAEELREFYGPFYPEGPKLSLDLRHVPESVHVLAPYAEFWGISDDDDRDDLIEKAPKAVQENLKAAVLSQETPLLDWLAGDEADLRRPSAEYVAFSAMLRAAVGS